jgi:ring-1,2-phenylacetyl-CoA epoxidase subunit PaaE
MLTFTLKVTEIRPETADTVTICFKQPALKKVRYLAGQYLSLIFRINGRRYIRPYSFSSAPGVDTALELTVKRVPGGVVSNHIHDVVKPGDSIEALAPMGDFVFDPSTTASSVFFWGVGSGITPLISIIKSILAVPGPMKVNLVYGNRNHESMIFAGLISALSDLHPERFNVWHFHTKMSVTETPPYLVQGRITPGAVEQVMEGQQPENTLHYICGPLGLKSSVKSVLTKLQVPAHQILSEDFEVVKNPADFEHIQTQELQLKFNGVGHKLEVSKGKSILDAALDAGLELPYSCQTGNCSTCVGRLLEGSVSMIGLTSPRHDLGQDQFLLCCSYPESAGVYIEV